MFGKVVKRETSGSDYKSEPANVQISSGLAEELNQY